jgi:NAD(P)-dependent dehydrogenase (short-subunit alcohol dehydrogenase family)
MNGRLNGRLDGRVAIVTGGGSGIGAAICGAFAEEGASVAVVDVSESGAAGTAAEIETKGGTASFHVADVTRSDQLEAMASAVAARYGGIDILVNNAGIRVVKAFLEHTEEEWRRIIDVNLTGQFLVAKAVVPHLIARGKGKVVNVASIAGLGGRPKRTAYTASKFGIVGFTRALAMDLAGTNVCVNALCPALIASPLNAKFAGDADTGPQWGKDTLVGRWGQPGDVARAAVFLASDDADYITGSELRVDGGELAGLFRAGEFPR